MKRSLYGVADGAGVGAIVGASVGAGVGGGGGVAGMITHDDEALIGFPLDVGAHALGDHADRDDDVTLVDRSAARREDVIRR